MRSSPSQETPRQRYERERALLLPLPAADFDTAQVVYRHVNVEGFVAVRSNFYSVPWSYIGQVLPVRLTENEVIIYSVTLEEITLHALPCGDVTGERQLLKSHHPSADAQQRVALLRSHVQTPQRSLGIQYGTS